MNKKIIIIGMIGMLLLTSMPIVSSLDVETDKTKDIETIDEDPVFYFSSTVKLDGEAYSPVPFGVIFISPWALEDGSRFAILSILPEDYLEVLSGSMSLTPSIKPEVTLNTGDVLTARYFIGTYKYKDPANDDYTIVKFDGKVLLGTYTINS